LDFGRLEDIFERDANIELFSLIEQELFTFKIRILAVSGYIIWQKFALNTLLMRIHFLLLLLLLTGYSLPAQKVLAVENVHRLKRITFQPGDFIRFQTRDSKARFNGVIETVTDSNLVIVRAVKMENEGDATNTVFRDYVPLREIEMVYDPAKTYWKYFKNMYSGMAMIGGGMLITFTAVNSIAGDQVPDPTSVIIATGILTSGFIIRYIGRDKYRVGKRWTLRAMEPMVLEDRE
jgi:hypothetical protein